MNESVALPTVRVSPSSPSPLVSLSFSRAIMTSNRVTATRSLPPSLSVIVVIIVILAHLVSSEEEVEFPGFRVHGQPADEEGANLQHGEEET